MQLLVEEMGLADTVDPLGGSYYVETLTNQMRAEMERIIAQTDAAGGIVKLVSEGAIQSQVSAQAYRMHRAIESGAFPKVGVNRYRRGRPCPDRGAGRGAEAARCVGRGACARSR
jgi:methylmalonyl-CoA mutase N-terminal domain/subunit